MEDYKVLTAKDVQEFLRVSRATAYDLMDRKGFPSFKVGRCKRVMEHDFLTWINTNKQQMEGEE